MGTHAILKTQQEVRELLQDIFDKEKITNPEIEISPGAAKGDGYMSSMNKVTVTGDGGKVLNLIIKSAPKAKEFRSMTPIADIFQREIDFYERFFPAILKFQVERNIKLPFNNVPLMYKTQNTEFMEALVLENIRLKGFDLFDRRKFMDDEHAKFVLKKYGMFHAVSFAMQDQNKALYNELTDDLEDLLKKFPDHLYDTMEAALATTAELFNEDEDKDVKEALLKFKVVERDFFNQMCEKPKYNVINHGDCWCNNMMFKYDESNKISDMMLLDFQICRAHSPVFDLSYFLYVSCGHNIHDKLDDYLLWYYESLKNYTKDLGSDIAKLYPFTQLKEDWKMYARYGLVMGLFLLRMVLMEGDEVIDVMDIAESKEGFDTWSTNKFKQEGLANERVRKLCRHVVRSGFLKC